MKCIMTYDEWEIWEDNGNHYYLGKETPEEKAKGFRQVELGYEARYGSDDEKDWVEEKLPNGYAADITGEFDEPMETAGGYIWRYGFFRFLEKGEKPKKTERII